MSFKTLAMCALLVLQVLSGLASPVATDTTEELVMTPGGLIPKSNVHAVPDGARIHHTPTAIQIIDADGTILHSTDLTLSKKTSGTVLGGNPAAGGATRIAPRELNSGYVAYSYWESTTSSPISTFSTSWAVPPAPANYDGQLLYYFNGLVPNSFDAILQPVLQFGESPIGGGAYWAVASWYVYDNNAAYHASTLSEVKVGQDLTGVMTTTSTTGSGSGTTYNWNSAFTGIASSSLSVSTTEVLNWAYEALEIYTTASASDLPAGTTTLSNINIVDQNGAHPASISWTPNSDTTDKISMSILSSSSSSGSMEITYPLA
jgi:hypothetical protein